MWYLAIFMTSHYDLKQQEKKNNGVLGAWLGGSQIFLSYIWGGGSSIFFQRDWGGRQNFCLPHENVTGPPPPHLTINDSSLTYQLYCCIWQTKFIINPSIHPSTLLYGQVYIMTIFSQIKEDRCTNYHWQPVIMWHHDLMSEVGGCG